MPRPLKIVVTGPFAAGKTRFIKTISDIDVVSTERRISARAPGGKAQTTVALDYGRVQIGDDVLHLHGTPGQARFDFMWEILAREMAGLVLLVDASAPDTFPDARDLLEAFTAGQPVARVVAANKQDLDGAASPERLRRALRLEAETLVMPCVAARKTSVRQVLAQLAGLIGARP